MRRSAPRTTLLACLAAVPAASAQSAFDTVFLVHNVSDSIVAYMVESDGTPTQVGFVDVSDWPTDIAITPDGSRLAVTHATSNSIETLSILAVGADGSLTNLAEFSIPDSPLAVDWLADDVVAVASSVYGNSSFRVYRYTEDPTPALTLLDTESPGGFLTALEPNADRSVLYANDSYNNAVRAYTVNADGTVDLFHTEFTARYPIDIKVTPNGERMFAGGGISGTGHHVLGFDVNPDDTLTIDPSPFESPGDSPAYMCATSNGRFLLVGHGRDATLRVFAIDGETGALSNTGFGFDVGTQGTLGDVVEINGFVFVTDESTAVDGIYGLYSFTLNDNGSLTQNGPILATPGSRPESMVVWSPGACDADFNGDGEVNTLDVLAFLNAWSAGDPSADFNGDGTVNTLDVLAFLNAWSTGC